MFRTATIQLLLFFLPLTTAFAQTPEWWKQTSVYQIYPRSFQDSDGDGIGDLKGVISRLDYLKQFGVETLWLSPFFGSPQGDFGYDIADYQAISPEFGTMTDCEKLIAETHRRGMKIVFDLVMNHTSDQHPWFRESRASKDNPKRDWYIWQKGRGKRGQKPPTNWRSMTMPNGWRYDSVSGEYYWASFLKFQPDLNYRNPEVKKAMFNVVRFWLDKGVDGFRLDIFNCIFENQELKNNPFTLRYIPSEDNPNGFFQKFDNTLNRPESMAFARELRAVVEAYEPKRFLLGEVFGPFPVIKSFCGEGNTPNGLNLVFAFQTMTMKFTAKGFRKIISAQEREFAPPFMPVYVFSNHDRVRSYYRLGENAAKAKLLALFQMTVRGVPVLYNGEEIGMTQHKLPLETAKDTLADNYEKYPDWIVNKAREKGVSFNRDECRTPMQWSAAANAGFCPAGAKPWLPLLPDAAKVNVETEMADSGSLYNVYKDLIALRTAHPTLINGDMNLIKDYRKGILFYQRKGVDGFTYEIVINWTNRAYAPYDYQCKPKKPYHYCIYSVNSNVKAKYVNSAKSENQKYHRKFKIPPYCGRIYRWKTAE